MSWEKLRVIKEDGGLGLRELNKFNISMFVKQGWRLLNNVNPLVTILMKARYYPNSDFLDESIGSINSGSSYVLFFAGLLCSSLNFAD